MKTVVITGSTKGSVLALKCDITVESDLQNVLDKAVETYKNIDIWINNAGVNQPMCPINDAMMLGLSVYGTSKRGLTYFLDALAKEVEEKKLPIQIGKLSPGIMITEFITHAMGNEAFELPEKTKKVYNILGDYPDVIAEFLVSKMITNKKNCVRINWLTNAKASFRFMTCAFNKRDFFKMLDEGK